MKRNNKYTYGYQPKINFWSDRYDRAKSDNDLSTLKTEVEKGSMRTAIGHGLFDPKAWGSSL